MTTAPRPDDARSKAIRAMLVETAASARVRRPVRRVVLFASMAAAAALVVAGVGFGATGGFHTGAGAPGGGGVAAPTSQPTAGEQSTATPAAPTGPADLQGAGASQSPTPIATPAIDLSDPSTWIIGDGGVGPLSLGGSVSGSASVMRAFVLDDTQGCSVTKWTLGSVAPAPMAVPKGVSIWLDPEQQAADSIETIMVGYSGDYDASLVATSPKTSKGIGIGSTFAQLQAAYPGMTESEDGIGSIYWSEHESDGSWVTFQLSEAGGPVMYIYATVASGALPDYCS